MCVRIVLFFVADCAEGSQISLLDGTDYAERMLMFVQSVLFTPEMVVYIENVSANSGVMLFL
jgi:hypothetical protein